jgi:hypothetical protein
MAQKDNVLSIYRDHYCHDYHHDHVDRDREVLSVNDGGNDDNDARDRC